MRRAFLRYIKTRMIVSTLVISLTVLLAFIGPVSDTVFMLRIYVNVMLMYVYVVLC